MGFLDKAKAAAEQATAKAREGVDDVQTKRELGQAYAELGRTTFELVESGEVSHPQLTAVADRIRALQAKVDGGGVGVQHVSSEPAAPAPPVDPSQPPAMPT